MTQPVDDKVANPTQASQANAAVSSDTQETPEQINWRKFREERSRERKEKEELARVAAKREEENTALKAVVEALTNKPSSSVSNDTDEDEDAKINRKVTDALNKKEQELAKVRAEKDLQELPVKLKKTFSDFEQVCSSENLDYLHYHYPEVAEAFSDKPDSFHKWANVYKAVKRFVPNPDSSKDANKAEKNSLKPQSMSVGGTTKTGDHAPRVLDDKRRQDNWSRMQKTMRGG
jgi:hypothetical protein